MTERTLPSYAEGALAQLDAPGLLALLVQDEDRVPRNVIDACVAHGDEMTTALEHKLADAAFWESRDASDGRWWLPLHAAMILGLIPGERAGLALAMLMRRISQRDDHDLQDWLAGYWPALFANKPGSVMSAVRSLATDRSHYWYIRTNAVDAAVAAAERRGEEVLDEVLSWAANIAADESEDWTLRLSVGNTLLDFARERHHALLADLARRQDGFGVHFSPQDVRAAYSGDKAAAPEWHRLKDAWAFYLREEIRARQERWEQEETESDAADDILAPDDECPHEAQTPFMRLGPKIGRNDPCPCGSGRKYKRCCLGAIQ